MFCSHNADANHGDLSLEAAMSESTGKPTIQALRRRQRLFEKQIQDRASEFKTFATERTWVEEELSRSREELRTLAARLQAVREEERARLAREIHDELSGSLTALKMDLSLLPDRAAKDRNLFLEKITSMSLLIDDALARVHAIVTELRPVVLDKFGLVAAIEWQAGEFQERSGIACETYLPAEEILLDSDRSTAVFRILQEALTNVMRHANATKVVVDLRSEAETLILSVRDNGIGIDPKVVYAPNSTGLLGMRERALSLGGVIGITTLPEGGTLMSVRIPQNNVSLQK
jgi:signal transduction histidine kinase